VTLAFNFQNQKRLETLIESSLYLILVELAGSNLPLFLFKLLFLLFFILGCFCLG